MAAEELGGKLLKALRDFKEQRKKAEADLDEIVQRLQALESEEQAVMGGPVGRADLIAALCSRISVMAQIGHSRIKETLTVRINRPRSPGYPSALSAEVLSLDRISAAIAGQDDLGMAANALISAAWPSGMHDELTFDGIAIATLFEEQLKAGVARCIEAAPWPYPEPVLSLAQRRQRLVDIEVERAGLERRKAELVELIADAMTG